MNAKVAKSAKKTTRHSVFAAFASLRSTSPWSCVSTDTPLDADVLGRRRTASSGAFSEPADVKQLRRCGRENRHADGQQRSELGFVEHRPHRERHRRKEQRDSEAG